MTASVSRCLRQNNPHRADHVSARATFLRVLGSRDQGEEASDSVKQVARRFLAVTQLAALPAAPLPWPQSCNSRSLISPAASPCRGSGCEIARADGEPSSACNCTGSVGA